MADDELLEHILEALPVGITVMRFPSDDPVEAELEFANPAASANLGTDLTPFVGGSEPDIEAPTPTDPAGAREAAALLALTFEVAMTGKSRRLPSLEIEHGAASGHYQVSVFALGDRRAASVFRRIDLEIASQQALDWAMESLESANAQLRRFASTVAHDLKNPITGVRGHAELIQMMTPDPAARTRESSDRIVELADLAAAMIDDMLEYSTKPVGAANQPVALDDVLQWVTAILAEQIAAEGAEIESDPLPVVAGHPAALGQVLLNLVTNALRYRDPDRTPTISVRNRPTADSGVARIDVIDNGTGIAAADRDRVFDWGYRGASRTAGSGVGLAASRAVITNLGGEIWVGEGPPAGTTISLALRLPELS